jgi:hypothetical protein
LIDSCKSVLTIELKYFSQFTTFQPIPNTSIVLSIKTWNTLFCFHGNQVDDDELEAELDALGDDIALDDDTSYLDDAIAAPSAPTGVPGADSVTNKVSRMDLVGTGF